MIKSSIRPPPAAWRGRRGGRFDCLKSPGPESGWESLKTTCRMLWKISDNGAYRFLAWQTSSRTRESAAQRPLATPRATGENDRRAGQHGGSMIDGHRARAAAALLLYIFLCGCEDKAAKAAQDKKDCLGAQLRFQGVINAMCTPWSERRAMVISLLAEDAQEAKAADPDSDPSQDIFDFASNVTAKDCVRAGFPDPGEKAVDPAQHRPLRDLLRVIPPELAKRSHVQAAKARVETHAACDLWAN
jgi:hypothetical protein